MSSSSQESYPHAAPPKPLASRVNLVMTGTNEPPKSSTQKQLEDLDEDPGSHVTLSIARRRFPAAFGEPVASLRTQPLPLMPDELRALGKRSPAQVRLIVASGLWTRFAVTGTSTVKVTFEGKNEFHMKAPDGSTLTAAVADMKKKMDEVDVDYRRVTEADSPDLYFSFALDKAMPWTCLVLDCLSDVISVPLYLSKHLLNVPRPWEVDNTIEPTLPMPKHASLPGGHASYMSAIEYVLGDLLALATDEKKIDALRLQKLKTQIATHRERAGLHTTLDTEAGVEFGYWLGARLVEAAKAQSPAPWAAIYARATLEWV